MSKHWDIINGDVLFGSVCTPYTGAIATTLVFFYSPIELICITCVLYQWKVLFIIIRKFVILHPFD